MTRNLKVLGLAITAVLAMSAVWAASAQAADPELHCTSTTNTCTVTATEINRHTLNVTGCNVRASSSLHGTLNTKTVSSVSGVTAAYTNARGCGVAATVNMNSCTYTLNMVPGSNPPTANVDIVCPEGRSIVINMPSIPCTITVGPQTGLQHIVFNNGGGAEPTDVIANITIRGITYTYIEDTCPCGRGTFNDGTYNGESTLEGFNDNGVGQAEGTKVGLHIKPL